MSKDAENLLWAIYQNSPNQPASTTGTLVFYDGTGTQKLVGSFNEIEGILSGLDAVLALNPRVSASDFIRVDSDVEDYISYARSTLPKVMKEQYPKPIELRFIIFSMGAALEIQIAKDDKIKNKRMDVLSMLKLVVPEHEATYKKVHCYYLSTKHWDDITHREYKSLIAGPRGKEATARYYESVRQVLYTYYPRFLAPIDYKAEYGLQLDFGGNSLNCPER